MAELNTFWGTCCRGANRIDTLSLACTRRYQQERSAGKKSQKHIKAIATVKIKQHKHNKLVSEFGIGKVF